MEIYIKFSNINELAKECNKYFEDELNNEDFSIETVAISLTPMNSIIDADHKDSKIGLVNFHFLPESTYVIRLAFNFRDPVDMSLLKPNSYGGNEFRCILNDDNSIEVFDSMENLFDVEKCCDDTDLSGIIKWLNQNENTIITNIKENWQNQEKES